MFFVLQLIVSLFYQYFPVLLIFQCTTDITLQFQYCSMASNEAERFLQIQKSGQYSILRSFFCSKLHI